MGACPAPTRAANVRAATPVREPLPGGRILLRVFWLLVVAVVSGLGYSTLSGSHAGGHGRVDGNGNYLDAHGNQTTTPPLEVNAVLHPNPSIPVLLGVIVLAAIIIVLRVAHDERSALRILNMTMIVVPVVAVSCVIVGNAWFFAMPLDYWTSSAVHYLGFPFASVDVTVQPMTNP